LCGCKTCTSLVVACVHFEAYWLSTPPELPLPPTATAGIRDHFVQSVELKFNCFFLMPIIDTFPTRLREELESAYDEDLDEVGVVVGARKGWRWRVGVGGCCAQPAQPE
jgi:hypothetical protein